MIANLNKEIVDGELGADWSRVLYFYYLIGWVQVFLSHSDV